MKQVCAVIFEGVRHERSLILLSSILDPNLLRQNKFTDHESDYIKNLALDKLHRQRVLIEHVAMSLLESG